MDEGLRRAIEVENSPVICECNYKLPISDWVKKLEVEFESDLKINSIHYVKELNHSIKCEACKRHWCCDECAIEDDAIPGFLDQWSEFLRRVDGNITFINCLVCKNAQ